MNSDGSADGAPVLVSNDSAADPTDDELNDIDGSKIVYTAFESTLSARGTTNVYDISTGLTETLTVPDTVTEARIYDNMVAWVAGSSTSSLINWVRLDDPLRSIQTRGTPGSKGVEIGSRYIVW